MLISSLFTFDFKLGRRVNAVNFAGVLARVVGTQFVDSDLVDSTVSGEVDLEAVEDLLSFLEPPELAAGLAELAGEGHFAILFLRVQYVL